MGFSPLDQQLAIEGTHWSERIEREAVWLSGKMPFADVEEVLDRIGEIGISSSRIWERSQQRGSALKAYEEKERGKANALPSLWEQWAPLLAGERKRMGVAMDGAMVHIRDEGWKELKVGSLFEVGLQAVKDKETGTWTKVPQAQDNSYVAHLGGPAHFGELMWSEAKRRRWDLALDTQVVGDGAAWIWNLTNLHFGESLQVIDWYHAKAHLVAATRLLHPQDDAAYERALKQHEKLLFQGHARQLAEHFSDRSTDSASDELKQEVTYFLNNHRRMNYMELREGLWLIGSGMVESEAKQFKHRFAASGMRWSRQGIQNMIPIRAAVMANDFHDRWNRTFHPPPE